MTNREKPGALIFCILFMAGLFLPAPGFSQETTPPVKAPELKAPAQSEKTVAAPQNIKEASRIYVFLGWMWASIAVLIYFLRLKIKEADRLWRIRFFSPHKSQFP